MLAPGLVFVSSGSVAAPLHPQLIWITETLRFVLYGSHLEFLRME